MGGMRQISTVRDARSIERLQREYAELDAQAGALKIRRQKAAQHADLIARIRSVDAQADQLRSSWLAVVDPFGQLAHGDQEPAIAAFTEWTALEPKNPDPWMARGFAYWQMGQLNRALADFDLAVKLGGPMLSNSLAARGGLLFVMRRPKEAMADFGKAPTKGSVWPGSNSIRRNNRCGSTGKTSTAIQPPSPRRR